MCAHGGQHIEIDLLGISKGQIPLENGEQQGQSLFLSTDLAVEYRQLLGEGVICRLFGVTQLQGAQFRAVTGLQRQREARAQGLIVIVLCHHGDGGEQGLRLVQQVQIQGRLCQPEADVVTLGGEAMGLAQVGVRHIGLLCGQCLLGLLQQQLFFLGGESSEILAQGRFILRAFQDGLLVRTTLMEQHQGG